MSGPALSERARSERRLGWLLCTPAVIAMVAVTAYPIGYAVWLSLQRADLRFPNDNAFIGLRNYTDVLTSKVWWADLSTTLTITVVSLAIELVIGMAVALVLHRAVFVRRTVRTSVLIPYGIITVVASLAWKYAFTPGTGFVNPLLGVNSDLLGTRVPSMIVIIMTEVWKTTPFMALLILAGLQLIPEEVYEAAKMDGASTFRTFTTITLPLVKPALMVAILFRILDALRMYDLPAILTGGGGGSGNATTTLSILVIKQVRSGYNSASALSTITFVIIFLVAFIFVRVLGTNVVRTQEAQQKGAK